MKTGFRDRKRMMIIHQLEHNETAIKSKYENNGYWLMGLFGILKKTISNKKSACKITAVQLPSYNSTVWFLLFFTLIFAVYLYNINLLGRAIATSPFHIY